MSFLQQIPPLLQSRTYNEYSRYLHCYAKGFAQYTVDTSTAMQQDMCSIKQIPPLPYSRICSVYNKSSIAIQYTLDTLLLYIRICAVHSRQLHCYTKYIRYLYCYNKDMCSEQLINPLLYCKICTVYSRYLHCFEVEYVQFTQIPPLICSRICTVYNRYLHCHTVGYVPYTIDTTTTTVIIRICAVNS